MQSETARHMGGKKWSSLLTGLAMVFGISGCSEDGTEPVAASTLITSAQVIDGTGAAARSASVRIEGDRIIAVGELAALPGEAVVDGSGLVLAPGFIDTHSHHDRGLEEARTALPVISQGITTIVVGQDGSSHLPLADYLAAFEAAPAALNIASYIGHGSIRLEVMGDDFRRPATMDEIELMKLLVVREMAAGALGFGTGLEYDPGIYSETEEVIELAKVAAAVGGRYISHMRSEDRYFWVALDEAIGIGRETGMPVQISHIKLAMKSLWGRAPELIAKLDAARAEGIDISADIYPYEYWQSTMAVLLPERNFTDLEAIGFALDELAPPEGIHLFAYAPEPALVGKTILQIAEERGVDPAVVYSELLVQATEYRADNAEESVPVETIVARSMTAADIDALLNWDHTNVCSDGGLTGHPRGHGTYPRILGNFVRDRGVLGLEEAVHKMTGLAAAHMGFADRGVIREGAIADLVLFDPAHVIDRATIAAPTALSEGITRVWVAGEEVFADGAATGAMPGRALRRSTKARDETADQD